MATQQLEKQVQELLAKSGKILITSKKQVSGDGLAASLALFLALKKLGKNAEIILDGFTVPDNLNFLPGITEIRSEAKKLKKFIISLDVSQTGLENLSYDIKDGFLRIHVTPKQGAINPDSLKMIDSKFAYDLIITLDCPEIESLGKLYDHHRDLFYQIPVINIDNSAVNEQYGHLNLVDLTAVSVAELVYHLIKAWPTPLFDQDIATCLLTGLISKTKSFKTSNVTPDTLKIAGELIDWGADRKNIVAKLYQTKTIGALKLWGRVLSRLQTEANGKILWSKVTPIDFTDSGAVIKDVDGVIEELIAYNPFAQAILLFYQMSDDKIQVILETQGVLDALTLTREFTPSGDKNRAVFNLTGELNQAEQQIISALKSKL